MKINRKQIRGKIPVRKRWVIGGILAAAAVGMVLVRAGGSRKAAVPEAKEQQTAVVQTRDIVSTLSASGSLEAKDSYNITSLVEGEVLTADFEEGDQVEKGQILYQIDSSSMESQLSSSANSLRRAQESYEDALADYSEAQALFSGNTYKSTRNGYLKNLYIQAGDRIGGQTVIADVYDDKVMKLKVPFLAGDAAAIAPGSACTVMLTDTGEMISGTVSSVSNMDETISGGRIVRYVHVEVANPGGLTSAHTAIVTVGDLTCSEEGTFEPSVETTMPAEDLNADVEVEEMLVSEGDYVTAGTPLFRMTEGSADKLMRNYRNSLDSAQQQVENAEKTVDSTQDSYDNYTITAPISGQVVTKNVNAGETISRDSNSENTLAVIYDLSALTFEMSIDEMDIQSVKTGQQVEITADAFEGETFTGTVTNVSINGSYSNGVTNYPVRVTLNDFGGLIPGMNVTGTILLDRAEGVLAVPAASLMRGGRVYVKDESAPEEPGVPAGFRAVEVKTGLISDDYVEITEGLSEGDVVYVDQTAKEAAAPVMMGPPAPPAGGPAGGGPRGGGPRG